MDVGVPSKMNNDFFLDTGSPHHVRYVEDVQTYEVVEAGASIRYSNEYAAQGGTNVNFVSKIDPQTIAVRTYERGVEDETLSCGTGVTAAALVAAQNLDAFKDHSSIPIRTRGGDLSVRFEKSLGGFSNIWLIGPVEQVFTGSWSMD